jgi:benzoylformate decarboxylase
LALVFSEVAKRLPEHLDADRKQRAGERAARVQNDRRRRMETWLQSAAQPEIGKPMRIEYVYRILGQHMTDSSTVVDEALLAARFIDRYLPLRTERSYLGVAAGALGLGLPASLGAQMAWPDRQVMCVIGDGSLMYANQALWTAARYRIPVTVLVLNNRAYQILKDGMHAYKQGPVAAERMVGMDLNEPVIDICGMARAFGVPGEVVTSPTELQGAFSSLNSGPRLLDVLVQP